MKDATQPKQPRFNINMMVRLAADENSDIHRITGRMTHPYSETHYLLEGLEGWHKETDLVGVCVRSCAA